jgi:flagellar L-ring protein precursor FlgH
MKIAMQSWTHVGGGAFFALLAGLLMATPVAAHAREKALRWEPLGNYVARVSQMAPPAPVKMSLGSLWKDNGLLADISTDYKAHRAGDLVQIVIVQDTVAENSGSVGTDRSFKASSSINSLPGGITLPELQNLFSPVSAATLAGKAQASSSLKLRTTLMGRVVAVLPNGALVVEAQRSTSMNNERQTVLLRGLARPGDVAGDGSVLSTSLSDLEVELKGKGVISDGTRPPNAAIRWLLRLLNF